jgi:glycosyltransferase involved in cell wall biosynthesis
MRIALYHNLPPGGALRLLRELVGRSSATHTYDLFQVDLGDDTAHEPPTFHNIEGLPPPVRAVHRIGSTRPRMQRWASRGPLNAVTRLAELSAAEKQVAEAIDAGGYDLAFVHSCRFTQAPSLLTAISIPTLYYAHEPRRLTFEVGYRPTRVHRSGVVGHARSAAGLAFEHVLRRRDIRAVRGANALACSSLCTLEAMLRAYGRRAELCYPGVDTELFQPRADVGRQDSVLAVGALDPIKDHELVLAALALMPSSARPRLDIAYERCVPGYDGRLRQLADEQGVELRLHERITDDRLVNLYRQAIVTVGAAHLEPLGLTVLESLSSGTPVVAVREGGYRETVSHGTNGYLVDRCPTALASAIVSVQRGDLGADSKTLRETVVSQWDWDAAVSRIHRVFDTVAAKADAPDQPA